MKCSLIIISASPDRLSLQCCCITFCVEIACAKPRDSAAIEERAGGLVGALVVVGAAAAAEA